MKINKIDKKDFDFYQKNGWVKIKDFFTQKELLLLKKTFKNLDMENIK